MIEKKDWLPSAGNLGTLLNLHWGSDIDEVLEASLIEPLREFLNRPGKNIRGKMVEMGFAYAQALCSANKRVDSHSYKTLLGEASEVLEMIHAASLVIDDIQDDSLLRRGIPTLHRTLGMPLALNAGNWLYFWPLKRAEKWNLPAETQNAIYAMIHQGLLRAHFGQAIDIGIDIFSVSQEKIPAVCLASLELKSGALMAMAFSLGALIGGATPEMLKTTDRFGHAFGIALQMFDDGGNVEKKGPKQFEDLTLRRPSWVVSVAAEAYTADEFLAFSSAVKELPNCTALVNFIEAHALLNKVRARAQIYLEEALNYFEEELIRAQVDTSAKQPLVEGMRELASQLVKAYV